MVAGIDYLLPRKVAEEVLISTKRKIHYVPIGAGGVGSKSFSSVEERGSEDTNYLQIESFHFPIDRRQKFGLYGGDRVKIYQGWLSGLVFEVSLVENGFERKIRRDSTLFGNLIFIPIMLFILGLAGVRYRKSNLLTVEIGAMNLLLFVLIVYLFI